MKEQKKGKKKQPNPLGVRISPALHDLFSQAGKNRGLNIGEAYTVAIVDWINKNGSSPVIRAMVDEACAKSPEVCSAFGRSISKAS